MGQLNIHTTPEFEEQLDRYMRLRGLQQKSDAIRIAVQEGLQNAERQSGRTEFHRWIGMALKAPLNPSPRFQTEDDLWEKGS